MKPATSSRWSGAATASCVLVLALAACVPFLATKGTMPPPGPNGALDPSALPDFVAVAGPVGIAGYVAKDAVLDPSDRTWPVYASDLQTVVGHMIPGRGFVAVGVDPATVPTFDLIAGPGGTAGVLAAGMVREYVRNGAAAEAWVAVIAGGHVQPGGAGFPGSGYIGVACLSVPEGSRLVLLDRSPIGAGAAPVKTLFVGQAPPKAVSLWLDVLADGTAQTGTGRPDWWTSDSPC
jgi:hypothetical protein